MADINTTYPIEASLFLNENDVLFLVFYFAGFNLKDIPPETFTEEQKKNAGKNFIRLYKLLTVDKKILVRQEISALEENPDFKKEKIIELLEMIKDNL